MPSARARGRLSPLHKLQQTTCLRTRDKPGHEPRQPHKHKNTSPPKRNKPSRDRRGSRSIPPARCARGLRARAKPGTRTTIHPNPWSIQPEAIIDERLRVGFAQARRGGATPNNVQNNDLENDNSGTHFELCNTRSHKCTTDNLKRSMRGSHH